MNWKLKAFSILIICFALNVAHVIGQEFRVRTNPQTIAPDSQWYASGGFLRIVSTTDIPAGDIVLTLDTPLVSIDVENRPIATVSHWKGSGHLATTPYPDRIVVHIDDHLSVPNSGEIVITVARIPLDLYFVRSILDPGDGRAGSPVIVSGTFSTTIPGWAFSDGAVRLVRVVKPAARR